jgi:hypothetical protein
MHHRVRAHAPRTAVVQERACVAQLECSTRARALRAAAGMQRAGAIARGAWSWMMRVTSRRAAASRPWAVGAAPQPPTRRSARRTRRVAGAASRRSRHGGAVKAECQQGAAARGAASASSPRRSAFSGGGGVSRVPLAVAWPQYTSDTGWCSKQPVIRAPRHACALHAARAWQHRSCGVAPRRGGGRQCEQPAVALHATCAGGVVLLPRRRAAEQRRCPQRSRRTPHEQLACSRPARAARRQRCTATAPAAAGDSGSVRAERAGAPLTRERSASDFSAIGA